MKYIEYNFHVKEVDLYRDILLAALSDLPFESFEETARGLKAYIPETAYNKKNIEPRIASLSYIENYEVTEIEGVNWNEEWEKEYQPIMVEDQCLIRAPFHPNDSRFVFQVVIKPQMSFGTGHHDTTYLMVKHLLNENIFNKAVLDMGCGTGILAILADQKGANPVWAIDNDEWAYKNTVSNCLLNGTEFVSIRFGDKKAIPDKKFHLILANINKNILKNDMETYVDHMLEGSVLLMSGFFEVDLEEIIEKAESYGLKVKESDSQNEWAVVKCVK
jgi:ribosomal protein L11 methyltransferase